MYTELFKLIGADARGDRIASLVEITIDFSIAERPHGHPRNRDMFEYQLSVAHHCNRRVKFMTMAGQRAQLVGGLGPAGGFVENPRPQRQRLIGTNDIATL